MATYGSALYDLFSTDAILSTYYTDPTSQISEQMIDEDTKVDYPHLIMQKISDPSRYQHPDRWIRLRIWVKHDDFFTTRDILDRIYDIINTGYGTLDGFDFSYIQAIERGSDPVLNESNDVYKAFSDYRILFK